MRNFMQLVHLLLCSTSIIVVLSANTITAQKNESITTTTATLTSAAPPLPANVTTIETTTNGPPPTSSPVISGQPSTNGVSQTNAPITTTTEPSITTVTTDLLNNINSTTTTTSTRPPIMPQEKVEQVKKTIQERLDPNHGENRLAINRPQSSPPMSEFAPDSMEALASDATTRFGLKFINSLPEDQTLENVIISPLSLQNLLNMILLGSGDNSTSHQELAEILGYSQTELLKSDRLKPHEAMRAVFKSILEATHLTVPQQTAPSGDSGLLNTNPSSLNEQQQTQTLPSTTDVEPTKPNLVAGHLQTSIKDADALLSGQMNFTLANLVLTNKDLIELKPEYEKDLRTYYSVNVEQFSMNATSATGKPQNPLHERVNEWVKAMTHGQIEKLANKDDLKSEDLIMVLLNVAHFKGRWLHTFNPKATHERTFYNHGSERSANKAVKFMRQKAVFGYADFSKNQPDYPGNSDSRTRSSEDTETLLTEDVSASGKSDGNGSQPVPNIELSKEESRHLELTGKLDCSVLMLPFSLNEGAELSMIILLPGKRDGVADLQRALDQPTLNEIYRSLTEQQVQVELPKFSFEGSHDAKANLIRMGLKSIFQDGANLERMYSLTKQANGRPASVDKVIHKAKISVDESGAEAAAVSMASIVLRNFIRPPTPHFSADHPFLFIIRHNRSNMPLFMGRVNSL